MEQKECDVVVIGCGAAGMAAALEIAEHGFKTVIVEREESPGGILNQCIHNGFGLHEFKQELTGPEYAEIYIRKLPQSGITLYLDTTVTGIEAGEGIKQLTCYSAVYGVFSLKAKAIVLAMGCRERNRGNIGTAGSRPAGIFTAGFAQRLLNIDGLVPGKRAVIIGSGDIGLIMARRLCWSGSKVSGVVEIRPYPSGLTRNIVQCLEDFSIPLYLDHIVTGIYGKARVEGVEITPLVENKPDKEKRFVLECDTVLLSVGLIPENELSKNAGVLINADTNGPFVDVHYMTNREGIFACGNVLHVHDLVDFVSAESRLCGKSVTDYLAGKKEQAGNRISVLPGSNVKYVLPNYIFPGTEVKLWMRPLIVKQEAVLRVRAGNALLKSKKLKQIQPPEMIRITLSKDDLEATVLPPGTGLEIEIQ